MKGTVPKRLDISYDFDTSININHFYLLWQQVPRSLGSFISFFA